jgi:hypothetical protein
MSCRSTLKNWKFRFLKISSSACIDHQLSCSYAFSLCQLDLVSSILLLDLLIVLKISKILWAVITKRYEHVKGRFVAFKGVPNLQVLATTVLLVFPLSWGALLRSCIGCRTLIWPLGGE